MSNKNLGCLIIVGIIVFAFLINLVTGDNNQKPQPYSPDETDAWVMAKKFIKDKLKAPSTAEFPSMSESLIRYEGADNWTVKSYVDSQNSFEAMLRTKFTIKMSVNTETKYWTVTSLDTDP